MITLEELKSGSHWKNEIIMGDCQKILRVLPEKSIHCVVTSPPYWNLRDYGCDGQLGQEKTPDEYIENMVSVFRDVKRVLRDDGIVWLNLGSTYLKKNIPSDYMVLREGLTYEEISDIFVEFKNIAKINKITIFLNSLDKKDIPQQLLKYFKPSRIYKQGDEAIIPHRVFDALMADGWYGRNDIVWAKTIYLPESVKTRCTRSKEYMFLLAKNFNYFYDIDAIREPCTWVEGPHGMARVASQYRDKIKHNGEQPEIGGSGSGLVGHSGTTKVDGTSLNHPVGKNKRDIWTIMPAQFPDSHFATFPPELIEPCIKAGASEKGCCAACGAPYKRILKKVGEFQRRWGKGNLPGSPYTKHRSMQNLYEMSHWERTCECDIDKIVPCIVMDIFVGSGTTAIVSKSLGRNWVGLELSEKYAKMADKRVKEEWHNVKDDIKKKKKKNNPISSSQPTFDIEWDD